MWAPEAEDVFVREEAGASSARLPSCAALSVTTLSLLSTARDRNSSDTIAEHLRAPEAVPLTFTDPAVWIREIRHLQVTPRLQADFPPVDVTIAMRVSFTARTRKRGDDLCVRTFALDVELNALGAVQGHGYDVAPQNARLTGWWGDY